MMHYFIYHWEHKNVKLIARLGIFRHYCVFILKFFKQAVTKVFKVIMQLSFHRRKCFVTRKLSKEVTTLTVAKVL